MKRRMVGVIHVSKMNADGNPIELIFESSKFGEFRIAKNNQWERLKDLAFETVEALGVVYYQAIRSNHKRKKIFFIKKFFLKGDSFFDEKDASDLEESATYRYPRLSWVDDSYSLFDFYEPGEVGLPPARREFHWEEAA